MDFRRDEIKTAIVVFICWLLIMILGVAYHTSAARGTEPNAASIRVKGHWTGYDGHGSGTAIYSDKRGSWVLTAQHNTRDTETGKPANSIQCEDINGDFFPADEIAGNPQLDVALLWTTLSTPGHRPMASQFKRREQYWVVGWPHTGGTYRETATHFTRAYQGNQFGFAGHSIQGQSGGAIVNREGFVVGVVSASDATETIAPCGQAVFQFVKTTVEKHGYEVQCRGGSCPIVIRPRRVVPVIVTPPTLAEPPPLIVPPPKQPERSIVCPKCDALSARMDKLERRKPKQGEQGPPGRDGKDCECDEAAIVSRVLKKLPKAQAGPSVSYYDIVPRGRK